MTALMLALMLTQTSKMAGGGGETDYFRIFPDLSLQLYTTM